MKIELGPSPVRVDLSWDELALAARIGVDRTIGARKKGHVHRQAVGSMGDNWRNDILGAAGEMAFAKAAGVYWDGAFDWRTREDFPGLEVRTTKPGYRLMVRPSDDSKTPVVLVRGEEPSFEVCGWIFAGAAWREEWRGDPVVPGVFLVPVEALSPMSALTPLYPLPGFGGRV